MCLIVLRKPNFEIPYEKFEAALITNPDGFGLTYPGEKGLEVFRSPEEQDPEKLYRLVNEELINEKLMLHLRFTTAGATSLRNAHPFPVLEKNKDGIDLRMAHNGTLGKYKNIAAKGESDTRAFVREYVRPLFKRLIKGMDPEELMNDPFTKKLLEDQLTPASVLTFLDSEGNSLICNEEGNGGKQEDEWYYSNTYSFNKKHRLPVSKSVVPFHGGKNTGTSTTSGSVSATPRFTKKHNLKSITDTYRLTDETIDEVVEQGDGQILIKELIHEMQQLEKIAERLNRENDRMMKENKELKNGAASYTN